MLKYILVILTFLSLSGCDFPQEIKRVEKEYEVTEIKQPKRFKVSLKDVESGVVYEMVPVSKRCSNWKKLKIGSKWKFDEVTYQQGDKVYKNVKKVNGLCSKLKDL